MGGAERLAPAAEAELFAEALSCELVLPADFRAGADAGRQAEAEALLRGLARIEDLRSEDGGEERGEAHLQLQHMDAKLDLALVLLGRLLSQSAPALPACPLRWSARGLRLQLGQPDDGALPAAGTAGVLRLQPADWLPDRLELPATVLAVAPTPGGAWLWLRFPPLKPGLEDALERHLFRMHRRQIADERRR
ncbi:PilZ domain-containing protein [Pseudoxanthomonas sp. J35]|uniref:PilZ domain-containing protein n=1 Tax=Pseudoxanthomonas sp. J35 TaxID=935852 RepID=UPI00049191CC|nr:PilZ domain-containing protein [Pseudoxanthomonas sp. J35]